MWGNDHEITAVELRPEIAAIYQDFFPNDQVVVGDAHQYLLEHYREFDFIWSSPPCQSHSTPIPSYDHFVELKKKAEKNDRTKVNGNYPDKISKLKSRIKKLLEKIEELESDSLAKKEGEEIVAELTNENNNLRSLLKECDGCVRCLRAYGVADCNGSNINNLITKIEEIAQKPYRLAYDGLVFDIELGERIR